MPGTRACSSSRCSPFTFYESVTRDALSTDTIALLRAKGHELLEGGNQGVVEVIVYDAADDILEGGLDRR